MDWVQAIGAFGGVALALIALVYARSSTQAARRSAEAAGDSAKTARRTADAAEETAAAAREEADNSRELLRIAQEQHARLIAEAGKQAVLGIDIASVERLKPSPKHVVLVLQVILRNQGDKAADGALVTILGPVTVKFMPCGAGGDPPQPIALTPVPDEVQSGGRSVRAHRHSWRIDRLPPGQNEAWHGLFYLPLGQSHELEIRFEHEDAEEVRRRYNIVGDEASVDAREVEI